MRVGLVIVLGLYSTSINVQAADIRVYSDGAPEAALYAITPAFEKASGHKVFYTFAIVTELQKRLIAGEKADVILMPLGYSRQ